MFEEKFAAAQRLQQNPDRKNFYGAEVTRGVQGFTEASLQKRALSAKEFKDFYGESHEQKGLKLELTDNPRDTGTKQQSVIVAESKELREANVGMLLTFGIRRATDWNAIKLPADQNMYATHAAET